MLNLFADSSYRDYIDLYYNDYIAMMKSIGKDESSEFDGSASQEEKNQYEEVTYLSK
jgi:hypothetical protein